MQASIITATVRMSARTTALALCSLALCATGASAAAPPSGGDGDGVGVSSSSGSDPGCQARSTVAFAGSEPYGVRHKSRIECAVPVDIECRAELFDLSRSDDDPISRLRSKGADACSNRSKTSARRYPTGVEFRQDLRFKLTLRRSAATWSGTDERCPRLSKDERTITCIRSQLATAPVKSVASVE